MSALAELIELTRQLERDPVLAGKAALELSEFQNALARFLEKHWDFAPDDPHEVVCRLCGARGRIVEDLPHLFYCPVPAARRLLK
jgi:hypothetical protein